MLRVLIVDDEKIVRKGLVSLMPWNDFDMTVVGEASNGEMAIQFMETNEIDLLITDLSMPLMSGIELMEEVRKKDPRIQTVVLTMHQDFEYVQEALRLGAIDYIVKTQLDKVQFEDILGRIAAQVKQRAPYKAAPVPKDELDDVEELFVLYALGDEPKLGIQISNKALEADQGCWYWTHLQEQEKEQILEWGRTAVPKTDFALICFKGLKEMDRRSILQLLRFYRKRDLFYEFNPLHAIQIVQVGDTSNHENEEAEIDMKKMKESWLLSDWIYDEAIFAEFVHELKALRLPPIRLTRLFYSLTDEWNRLYREILSKPITIEDFLTSWAQFEAWLREVRDRIKVVNMKQPHSLEIQISITKAMTLTQQMMEQQFTAGDIARMVNMSSSYFSQCFKEIVGDTYSDYLRNIRLERAKEYLSTTTKTIQWIAEQVGYNDEKYFSRLFRKQVGMLPSEYRQLKWEVDE